MRSAYKRIYHDISGTRNSYMTNFGKLRLFPLHSFALRY